MMRKLQTQAKRNTLLLLLSTGSILMLPIVQRQLNNIISKFRNTAHLMTLKEKESLIAQELLERLAKLNQKVQDKIKVQLLSMFEYKPKANFAKEEAEFLFLSGSAGGLAGLLLRALYQSFQFGVKEDLDPNNENKINQLINRKVSNMTSLRALFNKWQTTRGVRAFARALAAAAIVLSQLAATNGNLNSGETNNAETNILLKRPQTEMGESSSSAGPVAKRRSKSPQRSSSREIKLSEENLKQLKTLKSIQGTTRGFLDALEASAEKLKAEGVYGQRVIEIKPIYHNDEQLPGYLLILEDGSEKIITRVEYIQMIRPSERRKLSKEEIQERSSRYPGTILPVNAADSREMERIFRTIIVPIESIEITINKTLMETVIMPIEGVSLAKYITLKINNVKILDQEDHPYYENSLSKEEIKRYDQLRLTTEYAGLTTLKNTNCFL